MKYQTTLKDIRKLGAISIGYCAAQNLLRYETPEAYAAGVCGWNADLYNVGGVYICTGYRPAGRAVPYSVLRPFEDRAEAINSDWDIPWDQKRGMVRELLRDFLGTIQA